MQAVRLSIAIPVRDRRVVRHAVTGTNHGVLVEHIGDPQVRRELLVIGILERVAMPVGNKDESPREIIRSRIRRLRIKTCCVVVSLITRPGNLPSQSGGNRQFSRQLDFILKVWTWKVI